MLLRRALAAGLALAALAIWFPRLAGRQPLGPEPPPPPAPGGGSPGARPQRALGARPDSSARPVSRSLEGALGGRSRDAGGVTVHRRPGTLTRDDAGGGV